MAADVMGGCDGLVWMESVEYSWENGYSMDETGDVIDARLCSSPRR
jgi:hypothetical protein